MPRTQSPYLSFPAIKAKAETVADLAAFKALTSRPESVLVKTGSTAAAWQWELGSTTPADDTLVVECTSGEAGRYKRLDSVFYSTGAPGLTASVPYLGVVQKFGSISEMVAANATAPETTAIFAMTSAVGSGNITDYFKSALAACAIVNEGSASGWAQSNVLTIGAGGTKRGGIVFEVDLNNFWGNYTGTPSNPYAANIYCTGTNTNGSSGGYANAAMIVAFGGTGAMWNYGVIFQGATAINTATIADQTSTATSLLITGAHNTAILDWSGATTSGYQINGINFSVGSAGSIRGTSLGISTAPASPIHAYVADSSFQIIARLQNDNAVAPSAALGFSVTGGGETQSAKAGIFLSRASSEGRGTFGLANRISADSDDFSASNYVMQWDNANAWQLSATHFTANGSVATTITSLGPTGANTTIQEWLTVKNAGGTTRYIPCY